MKKSEVRVGDLYVARVSGKLVTVRLDRINEVFTASHPNGTLRYAVKNLATGRNLVFASAAKFRFAKPTGPKEPDMHHAGTTLPGTAMPLG